MLHARRPTSGKTLEDELRTYLESVARRDGMSVLVLADEVGFLVAGTGSGDRDGIAAIGAMCAQRVARGAELEALVDEVAGGAELYVSALRPSGELVYLVSVGRRVARPMEAADALKRILAAVLPA